MAYPPARVPTQQVVSYLRKKVTFADNGKAVVVGTIPAGALILKPMSGVQVATVFNSGTNKQLDIGTTGTANFYGAALSLAAIAFVPLGAAVTQKVAANTTITATVNLTGTAATAGEADVVIAFIAAEG